MKIKTHKLPWRPTPSQELLVQAALLRTNQAIRAWEQYEPDLVFETLETCSRQLLPLLHRNLRAHAIDHPLMERFKGIHRYTWYKNQLMLNKTANVLRTFHDAGIDTMILKGTALVLRHYSTYGLRPMNDVDVLVRPGQARAAMDLLAELEFEAEFSQPLGLTLACSHAKEYKDTDGSRFDLHWNALRECRRADADDPFRDNAVSTEIQGVATHAPSPTDLLVHVCVHAARREPIPRLIWIADAMAILDSSESIDWDRLVRSGQTRGIIPPLRDTLTYLHDLLDAPIPQKVLRNLHEAPVSIGAYFEYRAANGPQAGLMGRARILWLRYRWYTQSPEGAAQQPEYFCFARFLQRYWAVPQLWTIPFYAVAKAVRRIWRGRRQVPVAVSSGLKR